jgi:hypothetical protein
VKAKLFVRSLSLVAAGAALGGLVVARVSPLPRTQAAGPAAAVTGGVDLVALRADVDRLKEAVPSQSHAMTDVGYQFANLWFAADRKNWPLATFYFNETRSHIRWTIRIRPVRKNLAGNPVELKGIFDGIENGVMDSLKEAIEKKDRGRFVTSYRQMVEACYACHKASDKPFLRPMIPLTESQSIINPDPNATWPE